MRNLFDQYEQPENRLTHALAVCLSEDRSLLGLFLGWLGLPPPSPADRLIVEEQRLPGEAEPPEAEAERRGLPDLVIHDDDEWCILIESKVQAPLTSDQLSRHRRTLEGRGFSDCHSVALTKAGRDVPSGVRHCVWSELYEWLGQVGTARSWAERLREYLRIAEARLSQSGYLTEGTLTMFDGFPFSAEYPYTYGEAKRLIRLALQTVRADRDLIGLGVDAAAPGRSAITGDGAPYVWDFLQLRDRPEGKSHTAFPHLTLAIHVDHLEIAVSIPNGVAPSVRRRLADLGDAGLREMHREIIDASIRVCRGVGWPEVFVLQRHYPSQRAMPIVDARMVFKLGTTQPGKADGVKHQPEWSHLLRSLLSQKSSNLHFAYSLHLPWGTPGLASRESLAMIASGWAAHRPLLDVLLAK